MKNPLVTIGIPTFNRANSFLKCSLESALMQTYGNFEIIVSDNCSTDGTQEFVRQYTDSRIRYHRHEPALRPEGNANYCLEKANGEYFLLLHDDDLIDPDFIETCIDSVRDNCVGLVRTGFRKIDAKGKVLSIKKNPHANSSLFEFYQAVLKGNAVITLCNTLYYTERLRAIGGFHSKAYTYQDIVATVKMASEHHRVDIEEPMASYRIHGGKLGKATEVNRWFADSAFIVEVLCELMPDRTDFFRSEGMKIRCRQCLNRARRLTIWRRPIAYYLLYNAFGRYSVGAFRDELSRKFGKIWMRAMRNSK